MDTVLLAYTFVIKKHRQQLERWQQFRRPRLNQVRLAHHELNLILDEVDIIHKFIFDHGKLFMFVKDVGKWTAACVRLMHDLKMQQQRFERRIEYYIENDDIASDSYDEDYMDDSD